MSARDAREFRIAVEPLEGRLPLSHLLPAAAAHSTTLGGQGFATITTSTPVVNGQQTTTQISGRFRSGGQFSGTLNLQYGRNRALGLGTGSITFDSSGDQVDLTLSSAIKVPGSPNGSGSVIRFKVTGGTGSFANATGQGQITGNVNYVYNYGFTIQGKLRT